VHRDIRKLALKKLFTLLENEAKECCYDLVLVLTSNKPYGNNLAKNFGYIGGEVPHYEYVKII
jgi:hypothetical protein